MGRTTTSSSSRRGILIHADDGTVSSYASSAPSVTDGMRMSSTGTGTTTTQQGGGSSSSSRSRRKRGATWTGLPDAPSRSRRGRSRGAGTGATSAVAEVSASDELDFHHPAESEEAAGTGESGRSAAGAKKKKKRRPSSSTTETELTTRTADDNPPDIPPSRSHTVAAGNKRRRQQPAAEEESSPSSSSSSRTPRRRTKRSGGGSGGRRAAAPSSPTAPSRAHGSSRSSPSRATTPVASNASSSGRASSSRQRRPPQPPAAASAAAQAQVAPRRRQQQRRQPPSQREQRRRHGQQRARVRPAAQAAAAAAAHRGGTGTGTATVSEDDYDDEDDDDQSVRIVRVLSAPTLVVSSSPRPFVTDDTTTAPRRTTTMLQRLVALSAFLAVQYGVVRLLSDWSRHQTSYSSPSSSSSSRRAAKMKTKTNGSSSSYHRPDAASRAGGVGKSVPFPLERVWPAAGGGGGGGLGLLGGARSIFDDLNFGVFGGGGNGDLVKGVSEFVAEEAGRGTAQSCGVPRNDTGTVAKAEYEFMTMTTVHLGGNDDKDRQRRRQRQQQQRLRKEKTKEKTKKKEGGSKRVTATAKRREEATMLSDNTTRAFTSGGGPGFAAAGHAPGDHHHHHWYENLLPPPTNPSAPSNPSSPQQSHQPAWSLSSFSSFLSSSSSPHGDEVKAAGTERRVDEEGLSTRSSSYSQHRMGDPPTLREYLTHPDGFHLAMAPAFFGFYAYFGALIVLDEELGVLDARSRHRSGDGEGGAEVDELEEVTDKGGGGVGNAIPYCIFCIRDVVRRVTGKVVRGGGLGEGEEKSTTTKSTSTGGSSPLGSPGGGAGTRTMAGDGRLLRSAAGASAGAMAAILLAAPGRTPRDAANFASTLGISSFADFPGFLAAFRGEKFEDVMRRYLTGGDDDRSSTVRLEDGVIPVAVTGFDLTSLGGRVLSRGCMARAARASATFPGLFQPVPWYDGFAPDGSADDDLSVGGKGEGEAAAAHTPTTSLLIDGGVTDTLGLNGLTALPGTEKRVVNLVVGSFGMTPSSGSHPPGPSRMPPGLRASSVVSVSIVNTPRCGPWAMGNGPRAVEAARRALSDALDVPMERGEEEGHYVLRIDASGFA